MLDLMKIHEVFPYLRVKNAAAAIGHSELKIGGLTLMLSDEYPECDIRGPESLGGTTFSIHLHVDDADALMRTAVDAGATVVREMSDAFYGERSGTVRDPFGHEWMLGHQIEEVAPEEMQRRYTALFA
jgi:PhnB protein